MKKLIWIVAIVVVVWLAMTMGAKDGGTKEVVQNEPVKIGVIVPVTGDVASIGQAAQAAIELAFQEINTAGGIGGKPVEVIYEDGKCNAQAASNAAQKLLNVDKVNLIIGGACSGETSSFVKTAMEKKVPVLSYCSSSPTLTGSGPYFFRNYPTDTFAAKFIAEYLYNKLGAKNVAVVYHVSDWGNALQARFEQEFKALGGNIALIEGVQQNSKDFRTVISKIKDSNADYVYSLLYSEGGIVFVNQAKSLALNKKLFFPETGDDPKFIAETSGKADIMYALAKNPENKEFADKVKVITKADTVPACAPQAYDAAKIVAQVMNKVGVDPDAFAAEMKKISYDGVSGKNIFDQNGDLAVAEFVVKRVSDGKSVEVK